MSLPVYAAAVALLLSVSAHAATKDTHQFDLKSLKAGVEGPSTEILTLGTAHLQAIPGERISVTTLIDHLAAFNPAIITIEHLSELDCSALSGNYLLMEDAGNYCWDATKAQAELGITAPQAAAKAEQKLLTMTSRSSATDRRALIPLLIAANDRPSALVQWLQLRPEERGPGAELNEYMYTVVSSYSKSKNEISQIAAPLAARLGLQRLFPIDDHIGDGMALSRLTEGELKEFGAFLNNFWDSDEITTRLRIITKNRKWTDAASVLKTYCELNSPSNTSLAVRADAGASRIPSASHFGRRYMAAWEARNLRMVGNIRSVTADAPGSRVLNIVGANHKGYFDYYLNLQHDVRIVDATPLLCKS